MMQCQGKEALSVTYQHACAQHSYNSGLFLGGDACVVPEPCVSAIYAKGTLKAFRRPRMLALVEEQTTEVAPALSV